MLWLICGSASPAPASALIATTVASAATTGWLDPAHSAWTAPSEVSSTDRDASGRLDDGALFLQGASAWFDCSIEAEVEAGDHWVVLLRVHRHHARGDRSPLVFHRSTFGSLAVDPTRP